MVTLMVKARLVKVARYLLSDTRYFWLLIFLFLWIRSIVFLDPDFGWRLTTGNLILESGVPKTDPYTYSMPGSPWVNHAWLTDLSLALLYKFTGVVGLAAFFSLLAVSSIYIVYSLLDRLITDVKEKGKWSKQYIWYLSLPVLLLVSASIFRFSGIRAQIWTWFLLATLLKVLFDSNLWKKFRYFVPLLFLAWVNLHGGFSAGLITLIFVLGIKSIRDRKLDRVDLFVILFSILATFINPF